MNIRPPIQTLICNYGHWNQLSVVVREIKSVCSFKFYINSDLAPAPKYFLRGNRKSQILHTHLQTNCSSLNNDLFLKNISYSPLCRCDSIENTQHFFLRCTRFNKHRPLLFPNTSMFILVCFFSEIARLHTKSM